MSNFSNRSKKISVKYPYKKKKKGRGKYRIEQRNGINIEKTLERANDVTSYIVSQRKRIQFVSPRNFVRARRTYIFGEDQG